MITKEDTVLELFPIPSLITKYPGTIEEEFKAVFGNKLNISNLENLADLCENLTNKNNASSQLVDSFAKKYLSNLDHSAPFAANYLTSKSKFNDSLLGFNK